ncbi:MAG: D-alanine--D-alanine ligase [Spirochaetaceae bacterium]|nr:D-alanine--D-alanine ligase [Spirochaetaceae bacterium]
MTRIALLYGGKSGEHEVSLVSAASIAKNLDSKKYEVLLIGIAKSGQWLLQDPGIMTRIQGKPQKAKEEAASSGKEYDDDPEAMTMPSFPPITDGSPVLVEPGKGLRVLRENGSCEALPCDIVFPALHGTFGEDGTIQGLLECAGLPYVGAGVLGSAIGMDKEVAKELWLRAGLPVVDFITVRSSDWKATRDLAMLSRKIDARFGWPCFIKPACTGSSVGTSKVDSAEGLAKALDHAFAYDQKVLIEEFISAREIECSVLGNEKPRAFLPGEIIPSHEFYDYSAKYIDPNGAELRVPATLTGQQVELVQSYAIQAYKACNLSGMARVDLFIDKPTGRVLLNEVNTIPGFTSISMFPRMCEAGGLPYPELLDNLVELGFGRFRLRASLCYEMKKTDDAKA